MATSTSMTRVLARLQHAKQLILQWLHQNHPPGVMGALAFDLPVSHHQQSNTTNQKSILESIFDSTVWAAVPKNRRSLERRLTRKHGMIKHFEAAIPKKNIVACLECGQWHERHTICGNCYKKVKQETVELKSEMGDDFKFNTPWTEIATVYEGEDRQMYKGKYIIERNKPRPEWFPKHLKKRVMDE